jgi:hypothetical protein
LEFSLDDQGVSESGQLVSQFLGIAVLSMGVRVGLSQLTSLDECHSLVMVVDEFNYCRVHDSQ